jgi:hypothetical protein
MQGILSLGAWAQVLSLQIASTNNTADAVFSGSISGSTLTVASFTSGSGSLAAGCALVGVNITPGTTLGVQLTGTDGTVGQTGTYTVSIPQTAGSGTVNSYVVNAFQQFVNISQLPTTAAAYITVNLL